MNFVTYIPDGKNTKLQNTPHVEAQQATPAGKEYFTVFINYLQEVFDTSCAKKTLELFAVKDNTINQTKPVCKQ